MTPNYRMATVPGLVVLLSLAALGSVSFASAVEDSQYTRTTLGGLHGVYVVVGTLNPEIEGHGISTTVLKADTELQLRMAGIKVLSKKEWVKTKGGPVCYVEVSIVSDVALADVLDFDLYAFEVTVEFNQDVVLVRNTATQALCRTWSTSYLGITNSIPRIRDKVKKMVQRFIDAYLAVNPEQAQE